MGLLVRTAGRDQKLDALRRDYQYLRRLWDEIRIRGAAAEAPSLIYMEADLATRAIRDHYTEDIDEVWVDDPEVYARVKRFMHAVMPGRERTVKLYRGRKPLFRHFGVEEQCEEIYARELRLPSGGAIVIDPTEALTAIDVHSSRATSEQHIEETALKTNLEAAREIARQLRIRDIGGLVVIDFIDMPLRKHRQMVEEELRQACERDKARIQIDRISRFGLLELSRQRLQPSVRESTTEPCPRCRGRGFVQTVEAMALLVLSRIEDWAERDKGPMLVVQVPSDVGEYLMNQKREDLARIEELYRLQVNLQIRADLVSPHYRIERHYRDGNQQKTEALEDTTKEKKAPRAKKLKPSKPIVGTDLLAAQAAPAGDGAGTRLRDWWQGVVRRVKGWFAPAPKPEQPPAKRRRRRRGGRRRNRGGARRSSGGGNAGARRGGSGNGGESRRKAA